MRRAFSDQRGFTIVEVLVASAVLLIGLLGAVTMIDGANATNTTNKAREQGINLARELIEAGRSIPYAQLTPSSVVPKVQAMPNLGNANAGSGGGWTIKRRGVAYTVAMGSCAVDDPADGYGVEDPNLFCASNTGKPTASCSQLLSAGIAANATLLGSLTGTLSGQLSIGACGLDLNLTGRISDLTQADVALCALGACQNQPSTGDATPDDYKRIQATVTWAVGTGSRYVVLATTETNPGQGSGPRVTSLALSNNILSPITNNPLLGTLGFTATADSSAAAMQWSVNGSPNGSANCLPSCWNFTWNIGMSPLPPLPFSGEVLDGTYTVSATAFDGIGNAGPPLSTTVALSRRVPYAPANFVGGHDGSFVDFQWSPNKEGDITGYQVNRVGGLLQPDVFVCSTNNVHATSCQDTSPPASAQYYVFAIDKEGNGDHSATLNVSPTILTPNPPTNLLTASSNGNTVLAWTAPVPNADTVAFYRIYRDGAAISSRYDTAPATATTYTDTQTGGVPHNYRVTAVDPQLSESTAAGPVTG
jgi:prepilin-type N-terminal cleavage/methylation domain-containing protein